MDLIDVAAGELGYKETGNNQTKYGAWYGMNGQPWCHMFVSWCANKAGISEDILPKAASTTVGMDWFKSRGLFRLKGAYTPKRNDIVYFKSCGASHVGVVEKVEGNILHTIEGNSSSKVVRKTYPLNEGHITGYGVPNYPSSMTSTGETTTEGKKAAKEEMTYLKNVLKKHEKIDVVTFPDYEKVELKLPKGKVNVTVSTSKKAFSIQIQEGAQLVWERKGTPGKFEFTALYNKNNKISVGDEVSVIIDGFKAYRGYVFSAEMSKDKMITYTTYDQLRYFKNKETLVYNAKTAKQVIQIIADRFGLVCGELCETKIRMSAIEDNVELFDIVQNAIDKTEVATGKIFTLYDCYGELRLKTPGRMFVKSCLISKDTAEDYTYKISIDSETYNQIKLIYENKEKGTFDLYVVRDTDTMKKWGVLQLLDKIDSPDIGKSKSEALLNLHDRPYKTLTISGVIGNPRVRAGCFVPVMLQIQDIKIQNYMLVEKVTHKFQNGEYTMDLVVSGGGFYA